MSPDITLGKCHTTPHPEEFENGGFTLETHQMFSVHPTPEEFETSTLVRLDLSLRKTGAGKSNDSEAIVNRKAQFSKCSLSTRRNRKAGAFKFFWFEESFPVKAPFS